MSAVRMCDRDGTIFAEGAEGSMVGTVKVMKKNPFNGRMEQHEVAQDLCPDCANPEPVQPRLSATIAIEQANDADGAYDSPDRRHRLPNTIEDERPF